MTRRQAHVGGATLYVLIDPALGDPFGHVPGREAAVKLRVDYGGGRFEKAPYLLLVKEFGRDPVAQLSVEVALAEALKLLPRGDGQPARSMCGWIISTLSMQDLGRRIERNAMMSVGGVKKVFRFWDPRVMDFLDELLESDQKATLLAGADEWLWLDRRAKVKSWRAEDLRQAIHNAPASLVMSSEQTSALSHGRYANLVLDALQVAGWAEGLPSQVSLMQAVRHGMARWGLTSDQDCVMYVLYRVYYGHAFDEEPYISARMMRARSDGHSPVAVLEQIDASVWSTLPGR